MFNNKVFGLQIILIVIVFFLLYPILFPILAQAPTRMLPRDTCCYSTSVTDVGGCFQHLTKLDCDNAPASDNCVWNPLCDPQTALYELVNIMLIILSWIPFFAIIFAIIYLLIAGFNYVTAGSDRKKAEKARLTITFSIIGVIGSTLLYLALKILVEVIPNLGIYISP